MCGPGVTVSSFLLRCDYNPATVWELLKLLQLETDEQLLVPKARAALERYGHQVVIGNDLHRRKFEVVFVSRKALPPLPPGVTAEPVVEDDDISSSFVESWLRIDVPATSPVPATNQVKEIEEDIVAELVRRHERWTQGP